MSRKASRTRWSLRFNVTLLVLAVVVAPLLLVVAWLRMERQFESAMKQNAAFTLNEAVQALAAPAVPANTAGGFGSASAQAVGNADDAESAVKRVARLHRVRVRVLDARGQVLEDDDFDWGRDLSERAGGVVLRSGAHSSVAPDDLRGAIAEREETKQALVKGAAEGCEDSTETGMVVCYAARATRQAGEIRVVHVQDSAERPLPLLYALRFQLGRLTLVILPFALLLSFWVGKRLVGPLEALRDQVLSKVREQRPRADLQAPASNETQQLAQAFNTLLERLDERRNANEAFVADLVHEFKNPVATIRACGESLASSDVTPERAQKLARLLHESSTRLDALVSQFLELARAEAGMREEDWATVDLAALTRARVARIRDDERWQGLHFELEATTPVLVRGVAERLETVLDNLLGNAASFARPQGQVRVAIVTDAQHSELWVSDDGPGIAADEASRVFERFYTTRRHDKGTGLGLALVRAIVEAHGGSVAVASGPGQGATLKARFPALP